MIQKIDDIKNNYWCLLSGNWNTCYYFWRMVHADFVLLIAVIAIHEILHAPGDKFNIVVKIFTYVMVLSLFIGCLLNRVI